MTELPPEFCGCAKHRGSPGFNTRQQDGADAAVAAAAAPVSKDIRLNPTYDGRIHRADCWHLTGVQGFQEEADWNAYTPVDAAFIRSHRHLCCSTCDPGRHI